jgi:hypothetical protein
MVDVAPPKWDAPEFAATRLALAKRFQCSKEEAIAKLQALWDSAGNQIHSTAPARKKPTFVDFDLGVSISSNLPSFPASFAMDRIKSMEYVELWYFTTEGILDANKTTLTDNDDTFGFSQTDTGHLVLRQINVSRASRNVVMDEALTWEQISTARYNLLKAAACWPDKHRRALAEFYMNLEALKATGSHPPALILYQALVRRSWHATLKGRGPIFNPSNINRNLLNNLENQIRDQDHEELQEQLVVLSHHTENLFGERGRRRGRRRGRVPGRQRSSRSRSPRDKSPY